MSEPGPDAAAAAALRRLVERLDDAAAVLAGIRSAVVWDDDLGREWAARLDLVHRATVRLADDAAASVPGGVAGPAAPGGVVLPGTGGTRGTDRRGPVAPLLGPAHDPAHDPAER